MLENYYRINEAAGISIHLGKDGAAVISVCKISINNKQLEILSKIPAVTDIGQLKKQLPEKAFVSVNICGRGILYKQLNEIDVISAANFNQVLPNANFDDFYIQNFVSGGQSFVAVIRKTEAQRWIDELKDAGFQPLMLSLGPFPVQHILPQLNLYDNAAIFNGYTINRNEQKEWVNWSYEASVSSQFPLKAGLETLPEQLLIPYGAAFQLAMADKLEPIAVADSPLDKTLSDLIEERRFKARGALILIVFFGMLLINFGLFSWFKSADARLSQQVNLSDQSTSDIQKINQEIKEKEAFLDTLGWEGQTSKSVLIDQVASLLPRQITLREITVDPVDLAASRNERSVTFDQREIRMVGTSENIIPVNEWIARMKTRKWVKNIKMDSYTFNSELNTGQFIVLINY